MTRLFSYKRNKTKLNYFQYTLRRGGYLAYLYFGAILLSFCVPLGQVYGAAYFIDSVTEHSDSARILCGILGLALLMLAQYALNLLTEYLAVRLEAIVSTAYEKQVVLKASRLKYQVVEDPSYRELLEKIMPRDASVSCVWKGVTAAVSLLGYLIRILGIVWMIAAESLWIGLLSGLLMAIIFPIAYRCGQEDYAAYEKAADMRVKAGFFRDYLAKREYLEERALLSFTPFMNRRWKQNYETARKLTQSATKKNYIRLKSVSLLTAAVSLLISLLLMILVRQGRMTTGIYVTVVGYVFSLVHLMSWEAGSAIENQVKAAGFQKDFAKFEGLAEMAPAEEEAVINDIPRKIEFRNVSFSYDGDQKALDHFSFLFEQNKSYALVGKNGAGKTTAMKLLLKLYDQYEGEILVDGRELRTISEEQISRIFSVVFQDFARYQLSPLEQISIGAGEPVTEAFAEDCLQAVSLYEPGRLTQNIGKIWDDGTDLSGGQWQRMAIARSLARKAPVCILDEPTGSIDPANEKKLFDLFSHLFKDRMNIMVTHRLYSTKTADRILVLDAGQLAESGTHRELMEKRGIYYAMYEEQRSWYHEKI